VRYEWDEEKRASNLDKHGVDFEAMEGFDWRAADIKPSPRGGEMRYVATGRMGVRLHRAVFTLRGERVRIISLREANRREVRNYERP
jgi:uncharacterized DUF497 family protein